MSQYKRESKQTATAGGGLAKALIVLSFRVQRMIACRLHGSLRALHRNGGLGAWLACASHCGVFRKDVICLPGFVSARLSDRICSRPWRRAELSHTLHAAGSIDARGR
jgi:hypothetical protein